jgi:hypothetical protein
MEQNDYHSIITVNADISAAFESVQKRVGDWWTPNLEGSSDKIGDEFIVHFGDTFVVFKITELIANKKMVWQVTDCYLSWLQDKHEWTGTTLIWEFKVVDTASQISLTHKGLVPEVECYDSCIKGWNFFFKESLYKLLTEGKGMPETPKNAR